MQSGGSKGIRRLKISANWGMRMRENKQVEDKCNLVDKKE